MTNTSASFRRINWAQIDPLLFTGSTITDCKSAALIYLEYPYRFEGLTALLKVNADPVLEYWFKGGIEDGDFVLKTSGGGTGSTINFIPHTGLEYTGFSNDARTIYNTALDPLLTTPEKVGGFPAGTSVDSLTGKTLVGIIDDLLFPTVLPTYTIPTISISSGIGRVQEIGSIISPELTVYGVKNDAGAYTQFDILRGATTIYTSAPSTSPDNNLPQQFGYNDPNNPNYNYTISRIDSTYFIPSGVTTPTLTKYKGIGTYNAGLPKMNNKGVADSRLSLIRNVDAPQSSDTNFATDFITIYGYYPYYYGKSLSRKTPAEIVSIIESGSGFVKVIADGGGTLTMDFNAVGEWPWFVVFNQYPNKNRWVDVNNYLNNGNIGTNTTDLFSAPTVSLITSHESFWSGISFKVYVAQKVTTLGTCDIRVS
jgi:hypothetical protein